MWKIGFKFFAASIKFLLQISGERFVDRCALVGSGAYILILIFIYSMYVKVSCQVCEDDLEYIFSVFYHELCDA